MALLFASCSKEYDAPSTSNGINEAKTTTAVANSAWFAQYEYLLSEGNVLYALLASEAISETELLALNDSIVNDNFDLNDISAALNQSQKNELANYYQTFQNHFSGITFDRSHEKQFDFAHKNAVAFWAGSLPLSHYAKATDCEGDAAADAIAVLGSSIIASLWAAPATGGASVVGGVAIGAAASVFTWAVAYSRC